MLSSTDDVQQMTSSSHSAHDVPADTDSSVITGDVTSSNYSSVDYVGYTDINWTRLPGYHIRKHRKRLRTGWVWEYGYDIEKDGTNHRFWLCKECHQNKRTTNHMYDAASTSQANSHMEVVHRTNKDGPIPVGGKKQRTLFDLADLNANRRTDQGVMNAYLASFDPLHFRNLLVRWVACDNVPFNKLESPYFHALMEYANRAIITSGSLPTHSTIRDWIVQSFNSNKGIVTELLNRALSRINISFDAWSSRKFTSLLGLTVHFLDEEGKLRTFLLGLPQIEGRHTGENLAERVGKIITEFGFDGRVGYFVTDNAGNNDTCLEDLAIEFGFDKAHRRLRCCGHIINLVARSILFGTDADAFEEESQVNKEVQDEMKLWRSKGPVGKLHNIVQWVHRSGQRTDRLHHLQLIENTALGFTEKATYNVVTDNGTRWNSTEAMMERAYKLRNPLDTMVQAEVTEWNQYVAKRTGNDAKPMPRKIRKQPAIINDKMSDEDWSVIAEYLAILEPLRTATVRLKGRPENGKRVLLVYCLTLTNSTIGKFGAIWEVLPTMEWLLEHLEEAKLRHERDEESYLRVSCNLGWMKMNEYYCLTDNTPAYLASLVLHPAFRWSTVESRWSERPVWLMKGKAAVQALWEEYWKIPIDQGTLRELPITTKRTTDLDDFMASITKRSIQSAPLESSDRNEYAEWVATMDPDNCLVDNPIQYWLTTLSSILLLSTLASKLG